MSDIKHPSRHKGHDRRGAPAPATAADANGPSVPSAAPGADLLKRSEKIGGRHAAITNSLYNWHSYKNWADKMRGSWEEKK